MRHFKSSIIWVAFFLLLLWLIPLSAQVVPQPSSPTPIACAYNTSPVTLTTGQAGWVQCSDAGALVTSSTVSGTVTAAQATAANLNATVVGTGTFATQAAQTGTWTVQPGNTANTTPWLVQLAGQSFVNITTNADTNVKASAGTFVGIVVNTAGTGSTAAVYNDADGTCSSGLIGTFSTAAQVSLTVNAAASTGICVTTAGAGAADITILFR